MVFKFFFILSCRDAIITEDDEGLIYEFDDCLYLRFLTIKTAIEKSHDPKIDVKAKIGSESIRMLDQVFQFYYHEYEADFNDADVMDMYEYLQPILGLELLEILKERRALLSDDESSEDEYL